MQKISPCLWFDDQAEEAVTFYTSIFKNSKILAITHYGERMPKPPGSVMTIRFTLDGDEFVALNGGPEFTFSPAISLAVHCDNQKEVDELWEKLLAGGGDEVECGWLTDRFGVSWQIVPKAWFALLEEGDAAASQRGMEAMFKMKKLDLAVLERAYKNA